MTPIELAEKLEQDEAKCPNGCYGGGLHHVRFKPGRIALIAAALRLAESCRVIGTVIGDLDEFDNDLWVQFRAAAESAKEPR